MHPGGSDHLWTSLAYDSFNPPNQYHHERIPSSMLTTKQNSSSEPSERSQQTVISTRSKELVAMATQGSLAGLETFDELNVEYEHAYEDNNYKKACITELIAKLAPGSRVLDVGCGTGVPVSAMLAAAGLDVVGCDISPKMVELAKTRVEGSFSVSDMLEYEPEGKFSAVLMIFCHLQLSYAGFHAAAYKYASALEPGGLFALGQMPSEKYVKDTSLDETRTYAEDYNAPFMGEMLPTLMLSAEGQRKFLRSMGLEIVWEQIDMFQPRNDKCVPEEQQYIIAKRPEEGPLNRAHPTPKLNSS